MLGREHAQGREHAIGHPALTDAETGLANRLHFELVYSYLFAAEAGGRGLAFSVMLLSVDPPGKTARDRLRGIGERIQATTRDSDLVAHVGSGRYVVLLLGTNIQGARIAADRVEMGLSDVASGGVSFGLASYETRMRDSWELLGAADEALLKAEATGGGVEFA